jgi:hypothetical protein
MKPTTLQLGFKPTLEVVVGSIDNHPMLDVGYKSYLFVRNASVLLLESCVH